MIRSSPACWRKRIVCGDFVRVNLSLVMLPITVSSSLMRLMDCQISPLQFSVFWTSKLAEVTTYSPVIVHDASISVYFHFDKTLLFDVSWWLTVGAIMLATPLLPSECCLIIEELKATSLCFQVGRLLNPRSLSLLLLCGTVTDVSCYCLAVCSWAPNHCAHHERRISPRGAGEAPNAEGKSGRDLARLGAPWTQPWACSDAPRTTEKATPGSVAVGQ